MPINPLRTGTSVLQAVCKFNAHLISFSLTWMTDSVTITYIFSFGIYIGFLRVCYVCFLFCMYVSVQY